MNPMDPAMKHDFSQDPSSTDAEAFKAWLLAETVSGFHADRHDPERQKATVFLFVNRACEAKIPDNILAQIYGTAVVRGRLTPAEEDISYDWLEAFVDIARQQFPL